MIDLHVTEEERKDTFFTGKRICEYSKEELIDIAICGWKNYYEEREKSFRQKTQSIKNLRPPSLFQRLLDTIQGDNYV